MMNNLIGTAEIAAMLGVTREHVTDKLTKRPGFPPPAVNASRKLRRWNEDEVREWLAQPKRAAMSSADVR